MISFAIALIINAVFALVAIAFYTLIERKFLGYFQLRKGPNKVILMGLPQPFADAIKLITKERANPTFSNNKLFYIAPTMGLILTLLLWVIYPHSNPSTYIIFGILYFLCISRLNVYVTFISGWSSNSKYALLGALRGVAQTISYEVSITLILISAIILLYTIDLHVIASHLKSWLIIIISPLFLIWYITNLAETNRTPFDLAEGESELVSGFNIEYSSGLFAIIFIAEYANILIISLLTALFFSGSVNYINNLLLLIKTMTIAALYLWVRATFPRIRYDLLIALTWKIFLPASLIIILLTSSLIYYIYWYRAGWTDNSDDVNHG